MDWPDYLRDEAAMYRQLAEQADDPVVKNELLELASVCEEVANNIEDHLTGGEDRATRVQLHFLEQAKMFVEADAKARRSGVSFCLLRVERVTHRRAQPPHLLPQPPPGWGYKNKSAIAGTFIG